MMMDRIRAVETAIAGAMADATPLEAKLTSIEVAKRLLMGTVNGQAAAESSSTAIQLADELWDISLALFRHRQMTHRDILDFVALMMDFYAHAIGELTDEG